MDTNTRTLKPQVNDSLPPSLVRMPDTLQSYLDRVRRFPLLTPEEEVSLSRRAREADDQEAVFRLVTSHLRLVVKIAMDFQRVWMRSVLDLIQEGNVGLMQAAARFDPDKGVRFSYYATFWIRACILKFIRDNWRMVKLGTTQAQRRLFYNLGKERRKLQQQGVEPDAKALAASMGIEEEQVEQMLQRMDMPDMSLDAPLGDENDSSYMDFMPALDPAVEDVVAEQERSVLALVEIESVLPELSDKETDILHTRLLNEAPETLRTIGERHGVSRERIRQIEQRLVGKLRTRIEDRHEDLFEAAMVDA